MEIYKTDKEIVDEVFKILKINKEEKLWSRRGKHLTKKYNTTYEVMLALVSSESKGEAGLNLQFGAVRAEGKVDPLVSAEKGLDSAFHNLVKKGKSANTRFEKDNFKHWKNHFCNHFLRIHWCNICECYHPVEEFKTLKRGEKNTRVVEYQHACEAMYNREHNLNYNAGRDRKGEYKNNKAAAIKRRTSLLGAEQETNPERIAIYQRFTKNCPKGYAVDHIHPVALGGSNTLDNLCYLQSVVNSHKWKRSAEEWKKYSKQLVETGVLTQEQIDDVIYPTIPFELTKNIS